MMCIIPAANVKVFGRAIHSLSKIGEELYIEPLESGLTLRTVNSSRSAYACFIFAPSFFMHYTDSVMDTASNTCEGEFKYKINMKSCLTVFKSLSTLEKTVDKCKIQLDIKESRLVFQMYCRHGIIKTHNLAFIECETLQAVFAKDTCQNILTAQTKLLCESMLNFQTTQDEVTLTLDSSKMHLKNYVGDEPDPHKVVHTELSLDPDEFESYEVGMPGEVTFCLKELRAILAFSEPSNLPVSIYFDSACKPIIFTMETEPSFEANFVLATLNDKNASISCSQTNTQRQQSSQRITNNITTSIIKTPTTLSHVSAARQNICNNDNVDTCDVSKRTTNHRTKMDFTSDVTSRAVITEHGADDARVASHATSGAVVVDHGVDDTIVAPEHPRMFTSRFGGYDDDDDDDDLCSMVIPVQTTSVSMLKDPPVSVSQLFAPDDSSDDEGSNGLVPGTPPSKKLKSIFSNLSGSTTAGTQTHKENVLAADTDDED